MTTKTLIEKAIKGRWKGDWLSQRDVFVDVSYALMSRVDIKIKKGRPFQTIGKALLVFILPKSSWRPTLPYRYNDEDEPIGIDIENHHFDETWLGKQVELLLALAEGKTIEQFLETL